MEQAVRDAFLQMPDEELSAACDWEFFKATGNGGQKRNKTSSAARARLRDYPECYAEDCTERSQLQNRHLALKKLRCQLAKRYRGEPGALPQLDQSLNHRLYPYVVARVLDALAFYNYELAITAQNWAISTGQLSKFIGRDGALLAFVNQNRGERGLRPLKRD